jgi:GWxTD domain-containing protein
MMFPGTLGWDSVRLGWTLIHFVWQGALVAAVVALLLGWLREAPARVRYVVVCVGLVGMSVLPLATWILLDAAWDEAASQTLSASGALLLVPVSIAERGFRLDAYLPWLVTAWLAGVVFLAFRLVGGWALAHQRGRRWISTPPAWLEECARRLAARFPAPPQFRLWISGRCGVPQVVGAFKPVILLPAAAVLRLDPRQIEMILAHELAHIVRRDYLVNLLQSVVECVLFYHPAVWWLSAQVRAEREHCCDDVAVALCGDTLEYSRTLLALEESRSGFAVAFTGSPLRRRIARLLNQGGTTGPAPLLPILAVALMIGAGMLWGKGQAPAPPDPPSPPAPVVLGQPPAAPAPEAPPAPPAPPVPPKRARLTPEERAEVERAVEKARKQIEAARGEIEQDVRKAVEEARKELENKRPEIEKEVKKALEENRAFSAQFREEIQKAIQESVRAFAAAKIHQEVLVEAQKAALTALSEAEKGLREAVRAAAEQDRAGNRERERRIRQADSRFGEGDTRGSETARGKIYVESGPPDEIFTPPGSQRQVWRYKDPSKQKVIRELEFQDGKLIRDDRPQ